MFRFKQFCIEDNGATMKVGTDAVLLATLAKPAFEPIRILDIGTGCGVVALIMAQRFKNAVIDAIDIDRDTCAVASANFSNSPWANRLHCIQTPLQTYSPSEKYDMLICNPPYFSNSLHNSDSRKALARHDDSLDMETLTQHSRRLLHPHGELWLIQPMPNNKAAKTAQEAGLYLLKEITIRNKHDSPPHLCIYGFSLSENVTTKKSTLYMRESNNKYSNAYKQVTADFYLWENKNL